MRVLREKKLLITEDQYEGKQASTHKMQAPAYCEEEYWKKKETAERQAPSKLEKLDLEKILTEIKKHEGK